MLSIISLFILPKIDLYVYQCGLRRETKEGKSDGVTFICLRFDQYFGIKLDRLAHYRKLGEPAYTQFSSTAPNSCCTISSEQINQIAMMMIFGSLIPFLALAQATKFMSPLEDAAARYYSRDADLLRISLRNIIDEIGSDLEEPANSFMDYQDDSQDSNEYDNLKEIPLPIDYDLQDSLNPNPSIRDQEYLRHSTLWSYQHPHQVVGNQKIQQGFKGLNDKSSLPTYCTPPNPCPVGYTAEDHCLEEFENTAAFSRNFQNAQDCMCDSEHMIQCPKDDENSIEKIEPNYNIVERYKENNPYFRGEKLPIAAKKGLNVIY